MAAHAQLSRTVNSWEACPWHTSQLSLLTGGELLLLGDRDPRDSRCFGVDGNTDFEDAVRRRWRSPCRSGLRPAAGPCARTSRSGTRCGSHRCACPRDAPHAHRRSSGDHRRARSLTSSSGSSPGSSPRTTIVPSCSTNCSIRKPSSTNGIPWKLSGQRRANRSGQRSNHSLKPILANGSGSRLVVDGRNLLDGRRGGLGLLGHRGSFLAVWSGPPSLSTRNRARFSSGDRASEATLEALGLVDRLGMAHAEGTAIQCDDLKVRPPNITHGSTGNDSVDEPRRPLTIPSYRSTRAHSMTPIDARSRMRSTSDMSNRSTTTSTTVS